MANQSRVVRFADFTGGEFGDLGATGAKPGMFSGSNVMRYQDGSVGPRPGVQAITLSSPPLGPLWALHGLGYLPTSSGAPATLLVAFGCAIGSSLVVEAFSINVATGVVTTISGFAAMSTTATVASQIVHYGYGRGFLARYGDKAYDINGVNSDVFPTVTPLTASPGAKVLSPYGVRLMAANNTNTSTASVSRRVYYSGAADPSSWPALNYFDVGNANWPVSHMDELRQRLVIANEGGEWWAESGVPGVNDTLRRQPRGDLSPLQWYHATRVGESIWFFPQGEDFPVEFTGIVADKLKWRHLRFTGGAGSDWAIAALPVAEMVLATEDGGSNRGLMHMNGVWTYHTFGVTTSKFLAPVSVGGSYADLDLPMVLSDAAAGGIHFYAFVATLDRPGKTSDIWAQPGDNSTTPLTASFYLPAIIAREGHEIWVREVRVDGYTWNTGSSSTNHWDLTVRSIFREEVNVAVATKDSKTEAFDEAASLTTSDKTPRRWVRRVGDQQPGAAVQIRFDNVRGVAFKQIEVTVEERKRP